GPSSVPPRSARTFSSPRPGRAKVRQGWLAPSAMNSSTFVLLFLGDRRERPGDSSPGRSRLSPVLGTPARTARRRLAGDRAEGERLGEIAAAAGVELAVERAELTVAVEPG